MIVRNRDELATTPLRAEALEIIEAGINSVLPSNVMRSALRFDSLRRILAVNDCTYSLRSGRVFVVGGGKASGHMAEALETVIGPEHICAGVVNCRGGVCRTSTIELVQAGSPIPDRRGVEGVMRMMALKKDHSIRESDTVICLISGGGSALMPYPVRGVALEDKQRMTELLLRCGAEIHEINAVRKHLSRIKGGRLGRYYSPATVVSLILSDVIGNDLDVIASGPTVPDSSTFAGAYEVLRRYGLVDAAPESVVSILEKGMAGELEETPKALENCNNHIIGDNRLALRAMSTRAKELGLNPCVVTSEQKGDPARAARLRADEIRAGKYAGHDAILIGGETTPSLPELHGKGGRNQHYAAASMLAMAGYPGEWVVASAGTDGSDFLPEVAGAIVDRNSLSAARAGGVSVQSYLDGYDSNTLFERIGNSLIVTGDTGTNVCDIVVYILK